MKFVLVLLLTLASNLLMAQGFVQEVKIKVDDKTYLEVSGKPGLQTKKLNEVKIKSVGPGKVEVLSFDATMPEHDHGMVVEPTKPKLNKDASFGVKGVKLHMPGSWQIEVKVKVDGKEKVLKSRYELKP